MELWVLMESHEVPISFILVTKDIFNGCACAGLETHLECSG